MRTNIVIDDKLMADTLRATGLSTKREVVELGLKTLLRDGLNNARQHMHV
jgi:Arc/MetJ family transcription regulator